MNVSVTQKARVKDARAWTPQKAEKGNTTAENCTECPCYALHHYKNTVGL